jgi:hypothetical protein
VEGRTPQLLDGLLAGDADVVVVSAAADEPLDATRFDLHHLLDEELLVAVPRQHRLARRRVVRLAELSQENFIAGSATAETTLLRATLPSGFQPASTSWPPSGPGKLGCVAAGLGVALLPALGVRAAPSDLALLRLHSDDAAHRQIFAATVAGRRQPRTVEPLVVELRRSARHLRHVLVPARFLTGATPCLSRVVSARCRRPLPGVDYPAWVARVGHVGTERCQHTGQTENVRVDVVADLGWLDTAHAARCGVFVRQGPPDVGDREAEQRGQIVHILTDLPPVPRWPRC